MRKEIGPSNILYAVSMANNANPALVGPVMRDDAYKMKVILYK